MFYLLVSLIHLCVRHLHLHLLPLIFHLWFSMFLPSQLSLMCCPRFRSMLRSERAHLHVDQQGFVLSCYLPACFFFLGRFLVFVHTITELQSWSCLWRLFRVQGGDNSWLSFQVFCSCHPSVSPVSCRWVYNIDLMLIERRKAHLITSGFSQQHALIMKRPFESCSIPPVASLRDGSEQYFSSWCSFWSGLHDAYS